MPESPDKKEVGERLRQLRESLGLNQTEFARRHTMGVSAYNMYELGERLIPVHKAQVIAVRSGVTLDWIYSGDPSGLPLKLGHLAGPTYSPRAD